MVKAKPASQHELVGIQYLRAAAALMVVLDHASGMTSLPKYFDRHPFHSLLEAGAVGVDIFFCLSGFIIAYIGISVELKPKMDAITFYKRRFSRIVPFMWLIIILYAALRAGARGKFPFFDYVRGFTLFPIGHVEPNQVWTLRNELLFYIVFGLTFLTGRRWLLLAWVLSPFILVTFGLDYSPDSGGWRGLVGFLLSRIDFLFGMGVVIGILYIKTRASWPTSGWAPWLLLPIIGAIFALAAVCNYSRQVTWEVLAVGALSCLGLVMACATPRSSSDVLSSVGRTLGDASYCVYLTHTAIISAVLGLLSRRFSHASDLAIISISVGAAVVGGVILHFVLERPVVAWAQRMVFPHGPRGR